MLYDIEIAPHFPNIADVGNWQFTDPQFPPNPNSLFLVWGMGIVQAVLLMGKTRQKPPKFRVFLIVVEIGTFFYSKLS